MFTASFELPAFLSAKEKDPTEVETVVMMMKMMEASMVIIEDDVILIMVVMAQISLLKKLYVFECRLCLGVGL